MPEEAIKGLREIQKALKKFTQKEIGRVNVNATRAGAMAIKEAAEDNLDPEHEGKIGVARSKSGYARRGKKIRFNIGPLKDHPGLRFLEYGAEPHEIHPKKRSLNLGYNFIAGPVQHPGIQPTFFLTLALLESKEVVFKRMGDEYWASMAKLKMKRKR